MTVDARIHTPGDGRGARAVFVNGVRIEHVVFADERRGVVRYHVWPRRFKRDGSAVTKTRKGKVEVRPLDG